MSLKDFVIQTLVGGLALVSGVWALATPPATMIACLTVSAGSAAWFANQLRKA